MLFMASLYLFVALPILAAIVRRDEQGFVNQMKVLINLIVVLTLTVGIIKVVTGNILTFNDVVFQPIFVLKFIAIVTIVQIAILAIRKMIRRYLALDIVTTDKKLKGIPYARLFSAFILALGYFFVSASRWTKANFNLLTPEQIIYNLMQPMDGVDSSFIKSFIMGPVVGASSVLILSGILLVYMRRFKLKIAYKRQIHSWQWKSGWLILMSIVVFGGMTMMAAVKIDAAGFYQYLTSNSKYIETNYVAPTESRLEFPKKKRNIIYIYCESLESTATSKAMGGQMAENLLPELTELSKQGIHFSDSGQEFGGAQQLAGTGWTIAGMVAQTAGLPLKVPIDGNSYGKEKGAEFLPGATTLTDILAKNGYNQMALFGSDATFGGRRTFFTEHGGVKINDLLTARKDGRLSKDYYKWWGYEDSKLFEYAKESATKLSQSSKPFNLTMLTANTHHIGGYAETDMPKKYANQYSNVIAFSDHQIAEFIRWAQEQPFYENTTIIVDGDHLGMDVDYYKAIQSNKRHTFNLILNAPTAVTANVKTKNRQFGTTDMFPTTLAAMGVQIKGNRLALGTNLLSSEKTLVERDGLKKVNDELSATSKFYNNKFVYDK